jgi:hypothetical protein
MTQSDDVFFCLTWRGTILTRDKYGMPFLNEGLQGGIPANAARFSLHCSSTGPKLAITARLLPGAPAIAAGALEKPPAFVVIPAGIGRAAFLHLGKSFAMTPEDSILLQGRPEPDAFTAFVFVPEQELFDLLFIRDNQWLTEAGALIRQGETGFRPGFMFDFGEIAVDLRHGSGFAAMQQAGQTETPACPAEVMVLRDGWKLAGTLRLFRPLIYYTAFGRQAIFEQLRLSLRSLIEFGGYTGDVHVISDRPAADILALAPPALRGRLTVQPFAGMDYWDFAFARLHLPDWAEAAAFRPIIYVDTDIVFDRPVETLLKDIALCGDICVAGEPFSKFSEAEAVGAPFVQALIAANGPPAPAPRATPASKPMAEAAD